MQGKKIITPQLFYHQSLDEMVPEDNFYRKVNQPLSLDFLYKATSNSYGKCGQESIDPVVFFKILMVGYLNNINSDRALMRFCNNCLDIRCFLAMISTKIYLFIPQFRGLERFSEKNFS